MGIEISGIRDDNQKAWAHKCDADANGTLEGTEIEVFVQGNNSKHARIEGYGIFSEDSKKVDIKVSKSQERVVVGGANLPFEDTVHIKKNEDGMPRDYSVTLTDGTTVHYDEQKEENEAMIKHGNQGHYEEYPSESKIYYFFVPPYEKESYEQKNSTLASGFLDGRGLEISGSQGNNYIEVYDSKVTKIDGKEGTDRVKVSDLKDLNENIREKIDAEMGTIHTSKRSDNWGFDE